MMQRRAMTSRAGFGDRELDDQRSEQRAQRPSASSLLWRLVLLCVGIRIGLEAIGFISLAFHDQPT